MDVLTAYWVAVAATVTAAAILGGVALIFRQTRREADKTGVTPLIANWLDENFAYARGGFRLKAVLDCDHESSRARAFICKQMPPVPNDGHTVRLKDLTSRPFQRRKAFAWQVYEECVPFCAQKGWQPLEIHRWSRPDLIMPMNKVWTVLFEQGKVVIAPGWTPIPSLPNKRATAYNSFTLPPQP
jgi:hypothetical protein